MNASPTLVMFLATAGLFTLAVYCLSVAQTCADRVDGTLRSQIPVRTLLLRQSRAERTAAWAFALGFLVAMTLAGTLDASPL